MAASPFFASRAAGSGLPGVTLAGVVSTTSPPSFTGSASLVSVEWKVRLSSTDSPFDILSSRASGSVGGKLAGVGLDRFPTTTPREKTSARITALAMKMRNICRLSSRSSTRSRILSSSFMVLNVSGSVEYEQLFHAGRQAQGQPIYLTWKVSMAVVARTKRTTCPLFPVPPAVSPSSTM